jgi:hypothetical protein
MYFVGHVDFAQVRRQVGVAAAELPEDGVLAFFGDRGRWPGDLRHGDGWILLHTPRASDAVRLDVPAPSVPRRRFPLSLLSRPRSFTGPELLLGATAVTSLPTYDETEGLVALPHDSDALWETYFEEALPPEDMRMHQLLGYASWIQDDGRPTVEALARGQPASAAYEGAAAAELQAAARAWRLLWQIDSDERAGFMWGDAGNLQILIRDEDLRESRFERAWLTGACY